MMSWIPLRSLQLLLMSVCPVEVERGRQSDMGGMVWFLCLPCFPPVLPPSRIHSPESNAQNEVIGTLTHPPIIIDGVIIRFGSVPVLSRSQVIQADTVIRVRYVWGFARRGHLIHRIRGRVLNDQAGDEVIPGEMREKITRGKTLIAERMVMPAQK